jgi:methylmalonyl-CoA/ethylmalonyl-CoA epimerase
MFLINIDHIGIAVRDLDAALAEYHRQYRVEPMHREVVESQGVEEAMIAVGGSHIQLLQPLSEESPVGKFIASRGEGMHHVAYAVADLDAALEHLRGEDVRLIDEEPRIGGGGSRIAFVHPRSLAGTLIELVESA